MDITIKVPDTLAARAESTGVTPKVFVEPLLARIAEIAQQGLNRDRLRDDLADDWAHFQLTGLHLDQGEVDSWLAAMEQGQNPGLPELHA